jgi:alpha-galactosidase
MFNQRGSWLISTLVFLALTASSAVSQPSAIPPNAPAVVEVRNNVITITYQQQQIFRGELNLAAETLLHRTQVFRDDDKIQQVVLLSTLDWNKRLKISGKILGSAEAFPCEADRPSRGPLIVRHASGLSRSLRNRAVYDRRADWALSVDANPKLVLAPLESQNQKNVFAVEAEGFEIVLRFRPRFYQQHRGLKFFEPWTYPVWPHSVAGWISWFAFFDKVTEQDLIETAEVFSETLRPFGYEYFQMDDGYQQNNGAPELWLNPNQKFPHGLKYLVEAIKRNGLTPGIWTAAGFFDKDFAERHREWFLRDRAGDLVRGSWIEYPLDASNPAALQNLVAPLFKGLRAQGWEYFKLDGLRHLRYEGYNANRDYFDQKKLDWVDVYRRYAQTARAEIGRDHFVLGCWGIRPELAGIIDGCRIGDDGFAYAGLSQYNSFNNVVWRNDPDHIELNDDAYRSVMVTALTGSLLMLTDKPAVYRTAMVEPAKRAAPILFTRPGQIYDVDPSRSENLFRVDAEVSGSGPRPFDAGYTPNCFLYLLEIDRPFDYWCVLGRSGGDFSEIRFADLGLDPDREYFVFEFWSKKLWGIFQGGFIPGPIDSKFRAQAFCIRERRLHPQLIATSRHLTGGGVDLVDLKWDGRILHGESKLVARDPYTLFITAPMGYRFENFECKTLAPEKIEREGMLVKITLLPETSGKATWSAAFSPISPE